MDFRKVLNDVVPVKYSIAISWAGVIAGILIGYNEGKKVNTLEIQTEETEELGIADSIEQFRSLMVENDFRFKEQQEQINRSIQQMVRIVSNLSTNEQRSFDDYVAELTVESPPSKVDKRVDITAVGSEWDQETEVAQRDPEAPYVIHRNEYFNDDLGYQSHATLTYYQGDDVLCDEHDTPIYNVHKIVGHLKFGHGSNDPSIVYIRNEQLKAEYEVLLDPGMFQVEVLGEEVGDNLNDDLKHSHIRKFRSD